MTSSIQTKLTPLHSFREAASNLVSIGVVTFNEEPRISELLRSLFRQTWSSSIAELIVIDNGSTDQTIAKVMELQTEAPFPVRVFRSPANHMGLSRAMVIDSAQSPFVAFIDADCTAPENWIEELLTAFQKQKRTYGRLAGVGGPNRLPENNDWQKQINLTLSSPLGHGYSPQAWHVQHPFEADHLPTTNCLLLRAKVLEVGNFSTSLSRAGEDLELGRRLRKGLYSLLLLPEPMVVNDCAQDLQGWKERMQRFGRAQRVVSSMTPAKGLGPQLLMKSGFFLSLVLLVFILAQPSLAIFFLLYPLAISIECARLSYRQKNKKLWWPLVKIIFFSHFYYLWGWLKPDTTFAPISRLIWKLGHRT